MRAERGGGGGEERGDQGHHGGGQSILLHGLWTTWCGLSGAAETSRNVSASEAASPRTCGDSPNHRNNGLGFGGWAVASQRGGELEGCRAGGRALARRLQGQSRMRVDGGRGFGDQRLDRVICVVGEHRPVDLQPAEQPGREMGRPTCVAQRPKEMTRRCKGGEGGHGGAASRWCCREAPCQRDEMQGESGHGIASSLWCRPLVRHLFGAVRARRASGRLFGTSAMARPIECLARRTSSATAVQRARGRSAQRAAGARADGQKGGGRGRGGGAEEVCTSHGRGC